MNKQLTDEKRYILVADDDADDRDMLLAAFTESNLPQQLIFVENGEELMLYLRRKGKYRDEIAFPHPKLILLDLNMPKKDGREALEEIRADKHLKGLPIIVVTTSKEERDVERCYEIGANSFIIKPVTFSALLEFCSIISQYWFNLVEMPPLND
ncbi:CheY-like chemotaxis protein [Chitinophaga skermanii]|uniref:CheY-like chemotaxis protein n=1 Tax=Chitinophaga skermanii TaxID=331697 RepID=A0A327QCC5_9BACT|nr:response regulator [Chitinophaga skermanii]RAJ01625.1 CheY-like chemotaxis protein [Chitinophaga skermanii]